MIVIFVHKWRTVSFRNKELLYLTNPVYQLNVITQQLIIIFHWNLRLGYRRSLLRLIALRLYYLINRSNLYLQLGIMLSNTKILYRKLLNLIVESQDTLIEIFLRPQLVISCRLHCIFFFRHCRNYNNSEQFILCYRTLLKTDYYLIFTNLRNYIIDLLIKSLLIPVLILNGIHSTHKKLKNAFALHQPQLFIDCLPNQ